MQSSTLPPPPPRPLAWQPTEGWFVPVLVLGMAGVVALSLMLPQWARDTWVFLPVAVLGALAGWALGKSRFSGWHMVLFSALYGVFVIGASLVWGSAALQSTDVHNRSVELLARVNNFVYYALRDNKWTDELNFVIFVSLMVWLTHVYGTWALTRAWWPWPLVLSNGVLVVLNAVFYLGDQPVMALAATFVVLGILLGGQMSLLWREADWAEGRVRVAVNEARFEFLRASLIAALCGGVLAWAGPRIQPPPEAVALREAATSTEALSALRENFERLFSDVRNPGIQVNDIYGDSLQLGGSPALDQTPMFSVTVTSALNDDTPELSGLSRVPRYYWRTISFQAYRNGQWSTGEAGTIRAFDPGVDEFGFRLPALRLRREVVATITSQTPALSRLYMLGQASWLNRPATFEVTFLPGGAVDVMALRSQAVLQQGQTYSVVGSMSVADAESLRRAGTDYPTWVRTNYLGVSSSVSQRTRALAEEIVRTAGAVTPYDQAQAITQWLRDNITYDLYVAPPAGNVEPVDWFLFEARRGYCNYYASAMVLMLRSLGVPARVAAGFAEGEFVPASAAYQVRLDDAHAWPEVYFPDYGWVEFEPTTSEQPLNRPLRQPEVSDLPAAVPTEPPDTAPERDPEPETEEDMAPATTPPGIDWGALATRATQAAGLTALLAAALAGLALWVVWRMGAIGWESFGSAGVWWLTRQGLDLPSAVGLAYLRLERAARWLGLRWGDHLTPHERAASLSTAVPEAEPHILTITDAYVTEQYSPHVAAATPAQHAWQAAQPRLVRAGWHARWRLLLARLRP